MTARINIKQLGPVVFFVLIFSLIILGWWYQYSGEVVDEQFGKIVSNQYSTRISTHLVRVELETGNTVSADCAEQYRGTKVRVVAVGGRLTGDAVRKCIER